LGAPHLCILRKSKISPSLDFACMTWASTDPTAQKRSHRTRRRGRQESKRKGYGHCQSLAMKKRSGPGTSTSSQRRGGCKSPRHRWCLHKGGWAHSMRGETEVVVGGRG
jgi:hypothetical protein